MPTPKLTNEIIIAAIDGFESQKTRIDAQIAELRAMLPGGPGVAATRPEAPARKRKIISAAARRRMALGQKARWAKLKGESEPAPATPGATKPKRKLSASGRAAIVAALKKRWAAKKAEKPVGAKKITPKKAVAK